MKKTLTYCDTCEEEIKKGYGADKGYLVLSGRPDKKKNESTMIKHDDICHSCTEELFKLIYKFMKAKKKGKT